MTTRPQRGWFKPEALAGRLTEAQVALASHLAEGDALLRAAVRADERAQGAYRQRRLELADWQANLSDSFFDAFATQQLTTADLAAVVSKEVRAEPAFRAVSPAARRARPEDALSEFLAPDIRQSLLEAGVSASALREMRAREPVTITRLPADRVADQLREYSDGERRRAAELSESRFRRATAADRVRSLGSGEVDRSRDE